MANQARIQSLLTIQGTTGILYQTPPPGGANVPVVGNNGPTPGVVLVATDPGTDINLSELTALGGLCEVCNLDPNNPVHVGVHDPASGASGTLYPLMYLEPGDPPVIFRLSPSLQKKYPGTGTASGTTTLRMMAEGGSARVRVMAFDP